MSRLLRVICCAGLIGFFASGCGGGNTAPPTGSATDPQEKVQELIALLKHKKPASRSAACTQLGRLGSTASAALPDLEKVAKSDKMPAIRERAKEAITKIKGG